MSLILLLLLATSGGNGLKATDLVGTYEVVMIRNGQPVNNNSIPVGQVLWMKLEKTGTWQMQNMLSGWSGTWKLAAGNVKLTTFSGPSGKLKKPDIMEFKPSPNRMRMVLQGSRKGSLELRWDPYFLTTLQKRMESVKRNSGVNLPR